MSSNMLTQEELYNLPQMKWANEINKTVSNLQNSHELTGGGDNSAKLKDLASRITWLAAQLRKKFNIRYGREHVQDKHSTNAANTLMIYNKFSHVWVPYLSVADMFTKPLNRTISADANSEALADSILNLIGMRTPMTTVPPTYSGTRYQLFLNGIYDFKTNEFYTMEEVEELEYQGRMVKIEDMGFTDKHIHNIMFKENPEPPVFEGELADGGDWDFREWLLKVNNNDEDRRDYLLFLIGMMALPNTNIGINVVLTGPSGSGKSTIGTLVAKLYTGPTDGAGYLFDNSVMGLVNTENTADTLNDTQFPFRGTLTRKVNFVHLSEMNGTYLSNDGSVLFDKFGDQEMEARQLHKNSLRLNPTPTLYMEGTKWANFDSIKHGVERRLMPFELEPAIDLPSYEALGLNKSTLFDSSKILEWLIIAGFEEVRKRFKRYENITINMLKFEVPGFVQEWRKTISSGGDSVAEFYNAVIRKNIIPSVYAPGDENYDEYRYIRFDLLHDMFVNYEEDKRVESRFIKKINGFSEGIKSQFERDGYQLVPVDKPIKVDDPDNLALDLKEVSDLVAMDNVIDLAGMSNSRYSELKSPHWMAVFYNSEQAEKQKALEEQAQQVEQKKPTQASGGSRVSLGSDTQKALHKTKAQEEDTSSKFVPKPKKRVTSYKDLFKDE